MNIQVKIDLPAHRLDNHYIDYVPIINLHSLNS